MEYFNILVGNVVGDQSDTKPLPVLVEQENACSD